MNQDSEKETLSFLSVFSPLTKVKLINELNEREASLGVNESVSWHSEYKDSAWVFVGETARQTEQSTDEQIMKIIISLKLRGKCKLGGSKGFSLEATSSHD